MSDLQEGKINVRSATGQGRIGVDSPTELVQPVITDATYYTWVIKKLAGVADGMYTLSVDVNGRLLGSQDENMNVVASVTGPPTAWDIVGPKGGPYRIMLPGTNLCWTVKYPGKPKSPIILAPCHPDSPAHQGWHLDVV